MQPNRLGRILGIGTRVAVGKLRDGTVRAAAAVERASPAPASAPAAPIVSAPPSASRPAAASAPGRTGESTATRSAPTSPRARVQPPAALTQGSRRFARGAGRFSASLWRPFAHATGILWLQITGLFFAFFALGFSVYSWQLYKSAGWRDRHLPLYVAFALLFAWFAVSSFWRASRKQKRN